MAEHPRSGGARAAIHPGEGSPAAGEVRGVGGRAGRAAAGGGRPGKAAASGRAGRPGGPDAPRTPSSTLTSTIAGNVELELPRAGEFDVLPPRTAAELTRRVERGAGTLRTRPVLTPIEQNVELVAPRASSSTLTSIIAGIVELGASGAPPGRRRGAAP
ncbi:MAG TPA: hypothetical protein VD836_09480, partial [Solirubrobacteraceae bacterium]|nr:hypothetical protein [Solirubrobacteraceae bacterium]